MAEEEQAPTEGDATESDGSDKGLIAKIKSDKKLMIMAGGGALLLLLLIGGAAYYFLSGDETKSDVATEGEVDSRSELDKALDDLGEGGEAADESAEAELQFEKVPLYPLKSFFLPIKLKNKEESGRFLLVTPSFHMSNVGLSSQISKQLPLIREKIYTILRRESYQNLTEKHKITQERVKKRAMVKVNELLPVGTGVVRDIYFSEFIVK